MPTMTNTLNLEALNEPQYAAVTAPAENLLVLAGAGSGKTRVLVYRIAWLIAHEGVPPERILAVTFTNKAAAQMRGRIESVLKLPMQSLWVGTFHGMAHRMLRQHWQEAGLMQNFQVIDSDDQYRLIRRVLKNLNLDEARWPPKQVQWFINNQKELGVRPAALGNARDAFTKTQQRIYQHYEEVCQSGGLVDFAELLLRSYELLNKNPSLGQYYQERFLHILVDEFQDTNQIQYQWLQQLAGEHTRLMMVGDDDQSIYSWRGARVEHLQHFIKDFPSVQTIRLEQNYRSTALILNAANAVIAHNEYRLGKNLWTDGKEGEPISVYAAYNDRDEARFVVNQIQQWVDEGGLRNEVAILYRSNAQSRVLEEAFIHADMPYRIYGGLRFFDRSEIKDGLAYLRLVSHRDDDGAFDRVVNMPTRGIGESTLTALRECARDRQTSLWNAATFLVEGNALATRARTAVQGFLQLIEKLAANIEGLNLAMQTQTILDGSGLFEHFRLDRSEKGQSRVENLEELVNAAHQFSAETNAETEDLSPLLVFLSHVSLESGDYQADSSADSVHLMTLHAAKGLEFPLVFMTGMEEGLFPHGLSSQDPLKLEEERRLCYVGMTRAMQKLCLSYSDNRILHGHEMRQRPSRFIREIPAGFLVEVQGKARVSRPIRFSPRLSAPDDDLGLPLGKRVRHPHFGEGVILNHEGNGPHARVEVRFASGTKWLVVHFAKLELI